ncbi:MAG: TIGR02206 family membrane protein [Blastochloris sp.]|nr:TIGR02206 family membrane protein [Blastochloris sp.]
MIDNLMNTQPPEFSAYSPSHWVVLGLTLLVSVLMILAARSDRTGRVGRLLAQGLAALLLLNMLALFMWGMTQPRTEWVDLLPMHLCDWLSFIVPAALIWRHRFLYEISYFLGLAGTLHGLLTPDLAYGFPHFHFFTFFIAHAGIIVAVLYLSLGLGLRPEPASMLRAWAFIQVYLISAFLVNVLLDSNFGYLRAPPNNPSLIDHLGPWPWYLLSLQALAVLSFLLCYAPWWVADLLRKKSQVPT